MGACMLGPGSHPYAANPGLRKQAIEAMQEVGRQMDRNRNPFAVGHIDFSGGFF